MTTTTVAPVSQGCRERLNAALRRADCPPHDTPEERKRATLTLAVDAFQQIATGAWYALKRGLISPEEHERLIAVHAKRAYDAAQKDPASAPRYPDLHGAALQDALMAQAIIALIEEREEVAA